MMRTPRPKRNELGQMTIEMILLMVISLSISAAISNFIKSERLLANLVGGPWVHVRGMIENGVWAAPREGLAAHPNQIGRHGTVRGDD